MNRLAQWWRRVFREPAPMEHSSMTPEERAVDVPPERMAVIEELKARQHRQATEIQAETGRQFVASRRAEQAAAAAAIHRERTFWEKHGGPRPPGDVHDG